jgi:peptidoglycan-N-acetylmuramic acid deacetylase
MKKLLAILVIMSFILTGCSQDVEKNINNEEIQSIPSGEIKDIPEDENKETVKESGENKEDIKARGEIQKEEIKTEIIQTSTSTLSNQKCAWGFRRMKENKQPEFSSVFTKPLDEYNGIYVGNKDEKVIYLTFDEGYENGYTAEILDTLKEKEVPAIFFVTMPYVKQNKELVQRMIDEGHIVGNHTVNHPSMPEVLDDEKVRKEVMDLHDYVKENFNYEMTFIRPPKGEYSERTVKICRDLGYTTVLWSAAYDDWDVKKQDRLDYARSMIYNNLHNGSVMLLHAVSKDNTKLLPEVIDKIREDGYELCSLDEFVY